MARVLLIDNDKEARARLAAAFTSAGHSVSEATDGKDAIETLRNTAFELVVTEVLLPELDATHVVNYIDTQLSRPKVIALSAGNSQIPPAMALLLVKPQVALTFIKPIDEAEVLRAAATLFAA